MADEHLDTLDAIRARPKVRVGRVQGALGPEPSVMQSGRTDVYRLVFTVPPNGQSR